jgi:putative lipoprotein (rSAM/lipoprotein system)
MKKTAIRFFDKMVVLLLGIAGLFAGCDEINNSDPVVEYGMPSADYEISGTVTDQQTSKPIKHIQVVRPFQQVSEYGDTVYTDNKGYYRFAYSDYPQNTVKIQFEDIDGEENGGMFLTTEQTVDITEADRVEKGNGHWYKGKFVKNLDIELDKGNHAMYGVLSATFKP